MFCQIIITIKYSTCSEPLETLVKHATECGQLLSRDKLLKRMASRDHKTVIAMLLFIDGILFCASR